MLNFKMIKGDEKIQKNTKLHLFVRNFVRCFYNCLVFSSLGGAYETRTRHLLTASQTL